MTSVVVVDRAAQQLSGIDAWWREHRLDAEMLVVDEFQRCVTLLENTPELGSPFRKTHVLEHERENFELRRANEILRKASAFFAQAELDRKPR